MNRTAAALALAALALAACGKQTALQRPGPLFGVTPRTDPADANKPSEGTSVQENANPASSNATSRQAPIRGQAPDPFGGPSGPGFPGSGPGRE